MNQDNKDLPQVSLVTNKLKLFIQDFIMFVPKDKSQIIKEIKEISKKKKKNDYFTVTEMTFFERIND